jgi:hypothetical protein
MITQIISMEMGMGVVTLRKVCFFLGMMSVLRMRMVQGMVLVQFAVPVHIRACLGTGLGGLGIVRPTIRTVSGCHNLYSSPYNKNASPAGTKARRDQIAATKVAR